MPYLLVFLMALAVDLMPFVAPPAWGVHWPIRIGQLVGGDALHLLHEGIAIMLFGLVMIGAMFSSIGAPHS